MLKKRAGKPEFIFCSFSLTVISSLLDIKAAKDWSSFAALSLSEQNCSLESALKYSI